MDVYIKFRLTPGQSPPDDLKATGICLTDTDWIVWYGPEGTFPENDPAGNMPLDHDSMTEEEITIYTNLLNNPPPQE